MKSVLVTVAIILSLVPICADAKPKALKPIEVADDPYAKKITFKSDIQRGKPGAWMIRGSVDRETHQIKYQVYVSLSLIEWQYFYRATDDKANDLEVIKISSDVDRCNYGHCYLSEDIAVKVDPQYLKAHAATGLSFKVWGKTEYAPVIDVSPELITSALAIEEKYPQDQ